MQREEAVTRRPSRQPDTVSTGPSQTMPSPGSSRSSCSPALGRLGPDIEIDTAVLVLLQVLRGGAKPGGSDACYSRPLGNDATHSGVATKDYGMFECSRSVRL